jgi:flagellar protein FlbT
MSKSMQLWLKAGERLYVNGAVLRFDRKVAIELLNDVVFLREAHVLQADETTTPLRQLYFVLQTMLMNPDKADDVQALSEEVFRSTLASFSNRAIRDALERAARLVQCERVFDALKVVRGLFDAEAAILEGGPPVPAPSRAA